MAAPAGNAAAWFALGPLIGARARPQPPNLRDRADMATSGDRARASRPAPSHSHLVVLAGSIIHAVLHPLTIALRAKRRFLRGAAPRALQGFPQHRSLRAAMPGDPPPFSACYPRASPAGQRLQLLQPFPN